MRLLLIADYLGSGKTTLILAPAKRVAASCVAVGVTLIGHVKCVLQTEEGPLFSNLTSVRSGAVCRGDGQRTLAPGKEAKLDLAVLVYGLSAEVVDGFATDALERLLDPDGVYWNKWFSIHSWHS